MAKFSITEAAFEGFRLTRERPEAVALWTAIQIVFTVGAGIVLLRVPAFTTLATIVSSGQQPDLAEVQRVISELAPVFGAVVVAAVIVDAIVRAGVYRAVLRRGAPFALGADEVRMAIVGLATGLLAAIPVFIGAIVLGMLSSVGGAPGAAVGLFAYLLSFGVMITVYVRLSLAGPMSLIEGRIRVLSAAGLARGHAWQLFGAYFLAFILYLLVSVLISVVEGSVRSVLGIKDAAGAINAASVAGLAIQGLVAGLGVAILQAPAAQAYRQLAGPPEQADVF